MAINFYAKPEPIVSLRLSLFIVHVLINRLRFARQCSTIDSDLAQNT
jgi:hypothetical protein